MNARGHRSATFAFAVFGIFTAACGGSDDSGATEVGSFSITVDGTTTTWDAADAGVSLSAHSHGGGYTGVNLDTSAVRVDIELPEGVTGAISISVSHAQGGRTCFGAIPATITQSGASKGSRVVGSFPAATLSCDTGAPTSILSGAFDATHL